jgi:hypothetical protein
MGMPFCCNWEIREKVVPKSIPVFISDKYQAQKYIKPNKEYGKHYDEKKFGRAARGKGKGYRLPNGRQG